MFHVEQLRRITGPLVAACIIIAILGALVWFLFSLDRQVIAALIAAIVAVNVPLVAHVLQKRRELNFKTRDKKVEAYQKVFDFLAFLIKGMKSSDELDAEALQNHFFEVNHALIAWGSPSVTIKWAEFYSWISSQNTEGLSTEEKVKGALIARERFADLVKAIRTDLGHGEKDDSTQIIADLMWPLAFDPTSYQLPSEEEHVKGVTR